MRNLKRVLSLALAVVMVIGMMVMTTSAADFGDKAEIEYVEAVEVMSALGVLEGDDYGNFNPTDILTREQAAKIIAYMLLGEENAEKLNANNTVFKDVAAGRWSAGYISYCTTLGILAGVGEGNFDPTGELTGVAFGKMLLCALAYDAKIEGYVGADWATNIATDMISAGIDVKGVTLSEPLTREQAAQMALQTLEADIVTYDQRGWEMVLTDGTTVIVGASKARPETFGTYDYLTSDTETDGTLQFCEKYFEAGKTPMSLTKDGGAEDAYGRPGYKWTQKAKTIILVLDTPLVTYTTRVKADVVAADLNGWNLTVNGTSTKVNNLMDQTAGQTTAATFIRTTTASSNNVNTALTFGTETIAEAIADETANGKLVEVYAGNGRNLDRVVEVEYTVAKLTRITETKDKTTYNFSNGVVGIDYVNDNLTDNIKFHGDVARGEYVTMVKTGTTYQVYATTSFTGTQTDYTTKLNTIVIGGETYKVGVGVKKADGTNVGILADFNNGYKNAKYFVDQFGYVVAADGIVSNEYVYILAADATIKTSLNEKTLTVEARGIFADGSVGVYNIPVQKEGQGPSATWYVKHSDQLIPLHLDSTLADTSGVKSAIEGALEGKVFGYVKTDAGLLLEYMPAYDPATDAAGGVYQIDLDTLKYNKTTYGGSGNTYLVDSDTVFVVYNSKTKRADTYVGGNSLPAFFDDSTHVFNNVAAVMKYAADNTGLVSVAYVVTDGVDAEAVNDYVFVDTTKVTVSLKNGMTIYTYDGVKANGEVIQVSKKMSALAGDNVYAFDADCNITKDLNSELTPNPVVDARAGMKIVGNLVLDLNSGNYYELTDETVVVYVDDTLIGSFHGEGGWIVLTIENGAATTEIETIFVTEDLLLP